MARITSLNMLLDPSGKDFLAELYGKVIENVEKSTISGILKNRDLSGDPSAGSVEAKRFANAISKEYGTARGAGKGDGVKVKPVTVPIDVDKEIVEELENKDVKLYGVDGVLTRRATNHQKSMIRELERAFFTKAGSVATAVTTSETTAEKILEAGIQQLETTINDYVDGVDRDMMHFVCSPSFYGQVRHLIDTLPNANVNTAVAEMGSYHGVKVYSSVYLPDGHDFIGMVEGAVAQPVTARPYSPEKIPLSDAYAVSLFYNYGTKDVMPDLIVKKPTVAGFKAK